MKTNFLRHVAATLGLSAIGLGLLQNAAAQQAFGPQAYGRPGYPAPPPYAQNPYAQNQYQPQQQQQQPTSQPSPATLLPPTPSNRSTAGPQVYDAPQNGVPAALANFQLPAGYSGEQQQAPQQQAPQQQQRWNAFNNQVQSTPVAQQQHVFQQASSGGTMGGAPIPQPIPSPAPDAYGYSGDPQHSPVQGSDCQSCNNIHSSPYQQAASAPWGADGYSMIGGDCNTGACGVPAVAARPSIYPWFGGFNLLALNVVDNSNRSLAVVSQRAAFHQNVLDPGANLGFEVSIGRYLACGKYGIGVTYFHLDPDGEEASISSGAGSIQSAMLAYHDVHLNVNGDGFENQVYEYVSGTGGILETAGATDVRARRDMRFNGIEANMFCFGLMGAQRAAPLCGDGLQQSHAQSKFGRFIGANNHAGYGYGGAAGPLVRPSNGRVQVVALHGFRWFQFEESAQLAYNTDGVAGYQVNDIYDDADVQNDLFGYQFGGFLTYCLTNRVNLNVGGKFGLYANNVEARRRIGTFDTAANLFGMPGEQADTTVDDTVLASLGEIDLGLGVRLTNAWTVRGGYRVFGINGVATVFNQMDQDLATTNNPGKIHANDTLFLHGAYVGADFNF